MKKRELDSFIRNLTSICFPGGQCHEPQTVEIFSWIMLECENTGLDGCSLYWTCSILWLLLLQLNIRFSSLERGLEWLGTLFAINCNLPSETEEFTQLLLSNSLLDGYYHSVLNQTVFGMCFTDTVPNLYSVWLYGLDFLVFTLGMAYVTWHGPAK